MRECAGSPVTSLRGERFRTGLMRDFRRVGRTRNGVK